MAALAVFGAWLRQHNFVLRVATPGGDHRDIAHSIPTATGATCAGDADCESGYCDPNALTCSLFCNTDAECGSGNLCVQILYQGGWSPSECRKTCHRNSDCPANSSGSPTCFVEGDVTSDSVTGGCDYLGFAATFNCGDVIPDPSDPSVSCVSGVEIMDGSTTYCSCFCKTSGDCPRSLVLRNTR